MNFASKVFAALSAWCQTVWAIDLRAAAAFRMTIAVTILIDLANRLRSVPAFLTDDGLLPRFARMEMAMPGDPEGFDHQWSLHLFSGEAWAQVVLILIAMWFGLWLLVGYRTRLASVASWLLFFSLTARNPLTFDAGDAVMRCMLFWSMFVPLGARYSLDAVRNPLPERTTRLVSVGTAALLTQLLAIYFSAAMYKANPVWTSEFSGVYYALNCDPFVTSWGLALRQHPQLMKALTAGTFVLELCGPLALLIPWGNRWIRCGVVVAFWSFHVGLVATMTLGVFPWICIASWLLFVPTQIWDWLESALASPSVQRLAQTRATALRQKLQTSRWWNRAEQPSIRPHRAAMALAAVMFVYAILFNLRDVADERGAERILPHRLNIVARVVGLEKQWGMFAPIPCREDGWPVLKGTLRDGTEVNLWQPGEPLPFDKPKLVSALYRDARWRRYLENVMDEDWAIYRPAFADWLAQRWDLHVAKNNPSQRVAKVELLRQAETTPPPGQPFMPPETVVLWTKEYGETIQFPPTDVN